MNMKIVPNRTQIDYSRLQNSELSFPKDYENVTLFHYTSIGGLEGILGCRKIRFTNIKYMNDKDEIIAGLDSLAKACKVSEEEREKLRAAFNSHGIQTFVSCFSLEADSLPLWNYYTKEINNQGYNIEFDGRKLVESILRNNPVLNGCNLSYGIVDYSSDNDSEYSRRFRDKIYTSMDLTISKLFLSVAKEASINRSSNIDKASIQGLERTVTETEKTQNLSILPIFFYNGKKCSFEKNPSGEYLYFIKRDCFKQEREFRIVISVPDERLAEMKANGVYKFRISNGILIPFLELNFLSDVLYNRLN